MALTGRQKRELRAKGHALNCAVTVGAAGTTDGVLVEVERALHDHELIKIRVNDSDRKERAQTVLGICESTGAEQVQSLGRTALLFRLRPPAA